MQIEQASVVRVFARVAAFLFAKTDDFHFVAGTSADYAGHVWYVVKLAYFFLFLWSV